MRALDSTLTEIDINHLLALRSARVRQALPPSVPTDVALRLAAHGYVRSDLRGGCEITDSGATYLAGWFLFCQAFGCDGVLRRWRLLSPMHAGMDSEDPPLEHEQIGGRDRLTMTCRKCEHRNVLVSGEAPTRASHYVIAEALPPKAA